MASVIWFFFFKQKTAYEMRISDWSSDVCSSDLSRMKALAKLQPIAAMAEDPTLRFDFPSPTELKPPLVTLDMAAVGYEPGKPVLARINLRLDPDDRVALLGPHGNGTTPLARLLAAHLPATEGPHATRGPE